MNEASIERLSLFLSQALQQEKNQAIPSSQNITLSSNSDLKAIADSKPRIEISPHISMMQGRLSELREELPDKSDEATEVLNALENLDKIKQKSSSEEVQISAEMSKLQRFLSNINDPSSKMGKTISNIKNGISTAKSLAQNYNKIAEWCGLPPIC